MQMHEICNLHFTSHCFQGINVPGNSKPPQSPAAKLQDPGHRGQDNAQCAGVIAALMLLK